MDVSDQNNEESGMVFSSQHTEVIHWDDGEVGIIEDMLDGDGVVNACEGGSRLDPRS
jgi:hypothetical protein